MVWLTKVILLKCCPANIAKRDGDHGVRFADYDNDGDLDLALASNHQQGHHQLFRNDGKIANNIRILKVSVQAKGSAHQLIGAVVRVYQAGTDKLLGTKNGRYWWWLQFTKCPAITLCDRLSRQSRYSGNNPWTKLYQH